MSQKKILFRVDANPKIGMGHKVRMQSVYKAITKHIAFKAFHLGEGDFVPEAQKVSRAEASNLKLDLVIQDVLVPEVFKEPLVTIEDFGGTFSSDVVLCGNILKSKADFPNAIEAFCGPEYALLRPEFGNTYLVPSRKYDLAFLIGSGQEAATKVMKYLSLLSGAYRIALIVGEAFQLSKEIQDLFPKVAFFQALSVDDLIQLLLASRLAVISAGMSLYELSALGIPFLSFTSHPNQQAELDAFVDLGITKDISNLSDSACCALFETISFGMPQKTIDGKGALRAAEIINRLISTPRQALYRGL